ncbi:MAG: hypothetical protein A2020_09475 [Lentisphaerae bacterium GWF2_45_14]|nr:MAG: hypothetical protein A2020_09475 [Lentisphaerae bacterium GWF2_45_14]
MDSGNKKNIYFSYRSFWPELEAMKNFRNVGVDTICFFAANTKNSLGEPYCKYPPMWLWFDSYDFSPLDRQIEDILSANPDAELICMVDLNTPEWLVKKSLGHEVYDSFTELGRTVCSPRWLDLTARYMEAFLNYSESKYSGRIKAYVLACGMTCEWMDFSKGTESLEKTTSFQSWCREKGLPEPTDIPPPSVRNHVEHDDLLRDPEKNRLALEYWRFSSECIVNAIQYFIRKIKTIIPPRTEIGVFYGYNLELDARRLISFGHLDYERLLDMPELDFLISPGTYLDRAMGGGSGFMVPNGTMRLKGKCFMHECDQRTHTYNPNLTPFVSLKTEQWPDETATIAGMRREMALALINQTSLWWFDMWGGYYQGEAVYDNIRKMKEIWNRYAGLALSPVAETALIVDPESSYYFNQSNPLTSEFIPRLRNTLNRLGTPFDVYSFNDIPSIADFNRYKCVIFNTPFEITDEKEKILRDFVLKNNRTVVWLYAPGISDGKRWMPERVKELCGTAFGTPGISSVSMDGWKSVYVLNPAELTPAALKQLAEKAGVNIYCEQEIPVYANNHLLAIHTATGGDIKVTLPSKYAQVKELYSGKIVAENSDNFIFHFETPDTSLFELTK